MTPTVDFTNEAAWNRREPSGCDTQAVITMVNKRLQLPLPYVQLTFGELGCKLVGSPRHLVVLPVSQEATLEGQALVGGHMSYHAERHVLYWRLGCHVNALPYFHYALTELALLLRGEESVNDELVTQLVANSEHARFHEACTRLIATNEHQRTLAMRCVDLYRTLQPPTKQELKEQLAHAVTALVQLPEVKQVSYDDYRLKVELRPLTCRLPGGTSYVFSNLRLHLGIKGFSIMLLAPARELQEHLWLLHPRCLSTDTPTQGRHYGHLFTREATEALVAFTARFDYYTVVKLCLQLLQQLDDDDEVLLQALPTAVRRELVS